MPSTKILEKTKKEIQETGDSLQEQGEENLPQGWEEESGNGSGAPSLGRTQTRSDQKKGSQNAALSALHLPLQNRTCQITKYFPMFWGGEFRF